MFIKKFKPLNVVWETTLQCNMKCMHCGSSAGIKRVKELTTMESIKLCNELSRLGTNLITMMGGEPFLRKDWNDIARHVRDLGIELTIISNGFLINEKVISRLSRLNPYTVGISLDGGKADTHDSIRGIQGSFERCIKSLELLRDANIETSVITTVHKQNLLELPIIRDLLLNRSIAWQIQMATPIGRFPESQMLSKDEFYSVALFIASIRKNYSTKELPVLGAHNFGYHSKILPNIMLFPWFGCQAGLTTLGIQSDGGVKGCMSLPDMFIEDNIRNRSIVDIWNDDNIFSYNRHFKEENLNGECKICKYGSRCKGGCLTVSISLTEKNNCDPYCLYLIEKEMINK